LLDETANRALSLANTILKSNPNSLEALIMTSKVLEKQGKTREALEIALAISKSKNSPTLNHYIGLLYLHESDIS
jgi:predicted nucleotidyltransferase